MTLTEGIAPGTPGTASPSTGRRPAWWDRLASTGPWRPEAQYAPARGGHGVLAALRRHKILLGLAVLFLLVVAGVALGAVVLVAVLGMQIVGFLGQVELAGLLETARKLRLEAWGAFFELSTLREGQA